MVTVYKLDEAGNEVWRYPAEVVQWNGRYIQLEAFFNRDDMNLGYVTFHRGDRFVEYFYTDRYYNIFAIYQQNSQTLKGWYCNICRPSVVTETAVRCEDLALDLWVSPTGHITLLDEPEFTTLPLSPDERRQCWQAVTELREMARNGRLPR
jgi:hypothetical protein